MKLSEIVKALDLKILSGEDNLDRDAQYGYISDILSEVMSQAPKSAIWITNQTHENILALVYFKGLAGVILPDDQALSDSAIEKAQEKKIPLFRSSLTAFDIAGQLYEMGIRGR